MKYPKINTIFKRDMEYKGKKKPLLFGDYSQPEIEYLKDLKWECTEKIDGTNVRIQITPNIESKTFNIEFKGKTEEAQLHTGLFKLLSETFTPEVIENSFDLNKLWWETGDSCTIVIYGEGYGHKIQKCGKRYLPDSFGFILFDINIANLWLTRESIEDISTKMNIKVVPIIGYYTIDEAIEIVKQGFFSKIADDKTLLSEGLVLRTPNGLLDREGNRIITKIKSRDFNGNK